MVKILVTTELWARLSAAIRPFGIVLWCQFTELFLLSYGLITLIFIIPCIRCNEHSMFSLFPENRSLSHNFSVVKKLFKNVGWLCWGLTSQSTIFQSCRNGAIASWVINQYFRGVKCLAQGHNTAAVGFQKCNLPDFKFYLCKSTDKNFPIWRNVNFEALFFAFYIKKTALTLHHMGKMFNIQLIEILIGVKIKSKSTQLFYCNIFWKCIPSSDSKQIHYINKILEIKFEIWRVTFFFKNYH